MRSPRWFVAIVIIAAVAGQALAQQKYDPGASDAEIKIGNTMPYSGPYSANGAAGNAMAAYFEKINAEGGINGRRIKFISLDDAYSPAKTVEAIRRLVEQDEVLLVFGMAGTAPSSAVQKYLNGKKNPSAFCLFGCRKMGRSGSLSVDDRMVSGLRHRGCCIRKLHQGQCGLAESGPAIPK